jgi:pantoate--beta-alanine ligase
VSIETVKILHEISDLRVWVRRDDRRHPRVLVPTMGALHEGHLRLIDRARREAGDDGEVMVTIFVNPTQFGPNEDLDCYPRTLKEDLAACERRGADVVFVPEVASMYRDDASISIHEDRLSVGLCGVSRPGHFDGVCTVVAKLFHLCEPDAAVFGEKDYQQLAVVRRMVRDLDFAVDILAEPIVREDDGLAMSSRNRNLTDAHRQQAVALSAALREAGERLDAGERDGAVVTEEIRRQLAREAPDGRIDYVDIVDPDSLEKLSVIDPNIGAAILLAVFFGGVRLIDNFTWMGHTADHP